MSKKAKKQDNAQIDVNAADVESALNTEENEFGDIQVDILDDPIDEKPVNNAEPVEPEDKKVEPIAEPAPEAPVVPLTPEEPEVAPEPVVTRAPEPTPVPDKKEEPVGDIKVGASVKLNRSVLFTLDRRRIPSFAYDRVFTVTRIIPDRIFIQNKMYTISVSKSDVHLV